MLVYPVNKNKNVQAEKYADMKVSKKNYSFSSVVWDETRHSAGS